MSGIGTILSSRYRGQPTGHKPTRPEWTCAGCGQPYPCEQSRKQLIADHGHTADLAVHGVELMEQALADLPDMPVEELYQRFIAWTAPPRAQVRSMDLAWATGERVPPHDPGE